MALSDCWIAPSDHTSRPVAVLGAGVLGRRIASCWAAAGYTVHIYDPVEEQRREAMAYFDETKSTYQKYTSRPSAKLIPFSDMKSAVSEAWHVIECVPESLPIKQKAFVELEALTASDCVLATNSSSFRSSMVSEKMHPAAQKRVLNTHYFMLPHVRAVELMTNGSTAPDIFPFLVNRMETMGLKPFVAKKESTGFIQNRVWAAIKREMLQVVSQGVTDPRTADDIFFETIVLPGTRPFAAMDLVGLDTVAMIEQNYARERNLDTTHTVDFLRRDYIGSGKLGLKSVEGGFYPPENGPNPDGPSIFVLENGLSNQVETLQKGKVLEYSAAGRYIRTIFEDQYLPDGIVVLKEKEMMFWTCMGYPGQNDGMVYSSTLAGTNLKALFAPGTINTPKQIALDPEREKLYFSDREGLCVWRCNSDGTQLEQVITTGNKADERDQLDATKWCVGITVSPRLGKFFWTQKGAPKGWQGRIFSANMVMPPGETAANRSDVVCLLSGLAEPVDLDFHDESNSLYWTDRGEMPFGNTLNRLFLDAGGAPLDVDSTSLLKYQIIARKFHEAIGLKIDARNQYVYVADLGGSICRCRLDGSEKVRLLFEEGRAWTGIALG